MSQPSEPPEKTRGERRNGTPFGRRESDHSDKQLIWLEKYLRNVIEEHFGACEVQWMELLEKMMRRSEFGQLPARVLELENRVRRNQLMDAIVPFVCSMLGGGVVAAVQIFFW